MIPDQLSDMIKDEDQNVIEVCTRYKAIEWKLKITVEGVDDGRGSKKREGR